MTVAESLALAVLKGDLVAAYALADRVREEYNQTQGGLVQACQTNFEAPRARDGYSVYGWPEFRAFCARAGFMWNLRTRGVTFRVYEGEPLVFQHEYIGTDLPSAEPIETTTMHNEQLVTYEPLPQLSYEERSNYACKVCQNVPDEDGRIEHGRGCYTQDENGTRTAAGRLTSISRNNGPRIAERHEPPLSYIFHQKTPHKRNFVGQKGNSDAARSVQSVRGEDASSEFQDS